MSEQKMLTECRILEAKVIRENSNGVKKVKISGLFQRADEANNNKRIYSKPILESAIEGLQGKINERSLVGALDHPTNDIIHLSQASHLITKLYMKGNDVIGEAEILSTPSGKVVQALIDDGVKLGISSRGIGSLTQNEDATSKVNEDFKLVTFDFVADPSTRGAFANVTESVMSVNTKKVEKVLNKFKSEKVLEVLLMDKINQRLDELGDKTINKLKDISHKNLETANRKESTANKIYSKGIKTSGQSRAFAHASNDANRAGWRSDRAKGLAKAIKNPAERKTQKGIAKYAKGREKESDFHVKSTMYDKHDVEESTILGKYRKLINEHDGCKSKDYGVFAGGKGVRPDKEIDFKIKVKNPAKAKQTPAKGGKKSGGGKLDKSVKVGKKSVKENFLIKIKALMEANDALRSKIEKQWSKNQGKHGQTNSHLPENLPKKDQGKQTQNIIKKVAAKGKK